MTKLDVQAIRENAPAWKDAIPAMQTAVWVMCGGGYLGDFAAQQPADFYIDSRVRKLPYKFVEVERAVKILAIIAEVNGLDARNLPKKPSVHNLGVF